MPLRPAIALAALAVLAAALSGCNAPPPSAAYAEITFSHLEPYRFEVAAVEVVVPFVAPLKPPHVEHLSPTPPADLMRRWVADRIVAVSAVGADGAVRVTISDARIVMTVLKVNEDLKDRFTTEQVARYDARAEMLIEVLDGRNLVRAHAGAVATRSRTVPEGLNMRQRDQVLYELTEALIADLDRALGPNIERYLVGYLR